MKNRWLLLLLVNAAFTAGILTAKLTHHCKVKIAYVRIMDGTATNAWINLESSTNGTNWDVTKVPLKIERNTNR